MFIKLYIIAMFVKLVDMMGFDLTKAVIKGCLNGFFKIVLVL